MVCLEHKLLLRIKKKKKINNDYNSAIRGKGLASVVAYYFFFFRNVVKLTMFFCKGFGSVMISDSVLIHKRYWCVYIFVSAYGK